MKKSEMLIGLGMPAEGDGAEAEEEMPEEGASAESESEEDEAIDMALDPNADPATRRESFRRAVELCSKKY